jgi:uncharacterized protein YbjT (DUF2867 family)
MSPILIIGATGHVGKHLISQLHSKGYPIRALVRDRARTTDLPNEVEVVVGDLTRPETLPAAFAGVERIFLMDASHGLELTSNAVAAARDAKVQHIVNLSSVGAIPHDPMHLMGRSFVAREAVINESGIAWTHLRPSGFMTNALWWLPSLKAEGAVRNPIGSTRYAYIDPEDIAAVAAVALTQEGHAGQVYTLTGSELMTVAQQVEILAGVLGRKITYIPTTPEDAEMEALAQGVDKATAQILRDLYEAMRTDVSELVTDDVKRVTGSSPASFESWCRRNAAAFAW